MARIPTSRWPLYSTSLTQDIAAGATENGQPLQFEAERDTTFTDLSILIVDVATGSPVDGAVSIEYCNTDIVDDQDVSEWTPCCQRKPIFLLGVRENKKLRINVRTYAAVPALATYQVVATLSGFQGTGCCS